VLRSKPTNKFYVGVTINLQQRLKQHNRGLVFSTKHLSLLRLVYFESCLNKDDSYRRERYLKTGMGKRFLKNRLIGGLTG
jgi:putative endonuclease